MPLQQPNSDALFLSLAVRLTGLYTRVAGHFLPELHWPRALIQTLVFGHTLMKSDPSERRSNIHVKEKGSCLEESNP